MYPWNEFLSQYSPMWGGNTVKSVFGDLSLSTEHKTVILTLAVVTVFCFAFCYNPYEDKVS